MNGYKTIAHIMLHHKDDHVFVEIDFDPELSSTHKIDALTIIFDAILKCGVENAGNITPPKPSEIN